MWVSFKSIFSKDLALSSKYAGTFVLIVLKLSYNEMPAIIEALKRVFKDTRTLWRYLFIFRRDIFVRILFIGYYV